MHTKRNHIILLRSLHILGFVLLNVQLNFLITHPKTKEVLNALDTIRRRLQY